MAKQDSIKLSLYELKQTASLLNELELRRLEKVNLNNKVFDLEYVIQKKDLIINNYRKIEDNYKDTIRRMLKPWYDSFWVGATATLIVFLPLTLLMK